MFDFDRTRDIECEVNARRIGHVELKKMKCVIVGTRLRVCVGALLELA